MIGVTYLRVVFIQFEGIQQVCYTQHITVCHYLYLKKKNISISILGFCVMIFFLYWNYHMICVIIYVLFLLLNCDWHRKCVTKYQVQSEHQTCYKWKPLIYIRVTHIPSYPNAEKSQRGK